MDTQLPLNSFDTDGRLAMDTEEPDKVGPDKVILGSDLSIFGTVNTFFTEQEDPTQVSYFIYMYICFLEIKTKFWSI